MHHPVHHYLVPAVLLTVCRAWQQRPRELLESDLRLAQERALTVPGGACGFQGCCGAAVGVGIFWSIFTDCSPVSGKVWAMSNRATGQALMDVAAYGGPRCCKRCSWLAIRSALPEISNLLGISLEDAAPCCHFSSRNRECLRRGCPFYEKQEAEPCKESH